MFNKAHCHRTPTAVQTVSSTVCSRLLSNCKRHCEENECGPNKDAGPGSDISPPQCGRRIKLGWEELAQGLRGGIRFCDSDRMVFVRIGLSTNAGKLEDASGPRVVRMDDGWACTPGLEIDRTNWWSFTCPRTAHPWQCRRSRLAVLMARTSLTSSLRTLRGVRCAALLGGFCH